MLQRRDLAACPPVSYATTPAAKKHVLPSVDTLRADSSAPCATTERETLTEVATVCDCGLPIHSSCKVQHVPRNVCVFYKVLTAVSGCLHRCHKQQTSFFRHASFKYVHLLIQCDGSMCTHTALCSITHSSSFVQAANMLPQRCAQILSSTSSSTAMLPRT